jgi:CheY-like chemotaxis protein
VGANVLVVDDESDLRFLLRLYFEKAGHVVSDAGNGAAALESVLASYPDLVVTDMMMPVMGGFELIRELRADPKTAGIPILSVSGTWVSPTGADAFLAKPYNREELMAVAEGLLEHGRGDVR